MCLPMMCLSKCHLFILGTDGFIFKYLQFCRRKYLLRLSMQQCSLTWQSGSSTNVTTALPLLVAVLVPSLSMQCRLCNRETFPAGTADSRLKESEQVKGPAARRHASWLPTQSYLQWTTMGPASGGLQALTRRRKARIGVGYSGTP